jgi:hypothetical protein
MLWTVLGGPDSRAGVPITAVCNRQEGRGLLCRRPSPDNWTGTAKCGGGVLTEPTPPGPL